MSPLLGRVIYSRGRIRLYTIHPIYYYSTRARLGNQKSKKCKHFNILISDILITSTLRRKLRIHVVSITQICDRQIRYKICDNNRRIMALYYYFDFNSLMMTHLFILTFHFIAYVLHHG